MQKEKLAWQQPAYYLSKLVKDAIKSKLKYKTGDELRREVNQVIENLQEKIVKLELEKDELTVRLDRVRNEYWDSRKEIRNLRASGNSLSIED